MRQAAAGSTIRLFVDTDTCIGCGLCHVRAPLNLEVPSGETSARVVKQPTSAAEEAACIEAADYCPTGGLQVRTRRSLPDLRSSQLVAPDLVEAPER